MNEVENVVDETDSTEVTERDCLATIERVTALEPMEGKDRIEFIKCQGYQGVVQKGLHSIGDLVLVVKHETVVPEIPMFEFIRDSKFRVKSKSFNTTHGKVFSQIIVIPLGVVKEHFKEKMMEMDPYIYWDNYYISLNEGDDLTEKLGVKKYIPKLQNATGTQFGNMMARGSFPTFIIPKTDEMNVQGKLRVLEELRGKPYSITYKMEGSSLTSLIHPNLKELVVCSRNNMLKEVEGNSFWYVANKYNIGDVHNDYPHFGIQGELCGSMKDGSRKIQSNVMGLSDIELYVFNIYDLTTRKRLNFFTQLKLCKDYGIPHVPAYDTGDEFEYTFDELLELVQTLRYPVGNRQIVEGIVIRPIEDTYSELLKGSLSFKLKNPAYDLSKLAREIK